MTATARRFRATFEERCYRLDEDVQLDGTELDIFLSQLAEGMGYQELCLDELLDLAGDEYHSFPGELLVLAECGYLQCNEDGSLYWLSEEAWRMLNGPGRPAFADRPAWELT